MHALFPHSRELRGLNFLLDWYLNLNLVQFWGGNFLRCLRDRMPHLRSLVTVASAFAVSGS